MLMDIKPAEDRQGLINLSAAIEADALRITALGVSERDAVLVASIRPQLFAADHSFRVTSEP